LKIHLGFYGFLFLSSSVAFSFLGFFLGQKTETILELNRKLTSQATMDFLTGLCNPRYLHDVFEAEYQKHLITNQPLSCLLLDLDHFKLVNDKYGHPFGDQVLKQVGAILKKCIREGDIAARYGGEEFLCILPNCDRKEALKIAKQILKETASHNFYLNDQLIKVTISIGAAFCLSDDEKSYKDLIDQADKNLYKAKANGRNQIVPNSIGGFTNKRVRPRLEH
jgi:diguanylate cyclase